MKNLQTLKRTPKLAIVIPCYNEEAVIAHTYKALNDKLDTLMSQKIISKDSFLCFVDDGSRDKTCEILFSLKNATNTDKNSPSLRVSEASVAIHEQENVDCHANASAFARNDKEKTMTKSHNTDTNAKSNSHKIVKLSKNYGQQNALLAGLHFVKDKCDCVVSMDCDLQDDINAVDEMLVKFKSGAEVVYGVRKARDKDTAFKKYTALGFYKFMRIMGINIPHNHAHYRLLSARACENLLEFKEVNLFLRGIVPLLGYKSEVVYYERAARFAGETKYSFMSLFALAWDAITSFSIMPLRAMSVIGVILFALSIIYGAYALYMKFFTAVPISGWTSTILILLFFGGMQFLGLGIMGEYIGKIYAEVKHRPRYFVDEIL